MKDDPKILTPWQALALAVALGALMWAALIAAVLHIAGKVLP